MQTSTTLQVVKNEVRAIIKNTLYTLTHTKLRELADAVFSITNDKNNAEKNLHIEYALLFPI